MDWIFSSLDTLGTTALKALLIYLIIIIYTRISGLRTFGKLSSFDFAITIAIGSILASVILSGNVSLMQGMVALGVLITLQHIISIIRRWWKPFDHLVSNTPLLLMLDGRMLEENMQKVSLSESTLISKLREANVLNLSEVRAVIIETTGDISVLHASDQDRVLDDYLLKGVSGKPGEENLTKTP
ncbi:DUF421 domain-containing protein [Flavilitoribacter nigricans]|uniref:DUF421 domain-containing protein n=1 Tax=Flavilitoribacter nigricans (strain ATCC 23147 / DSM 23189 / NBRC 102662 / NCIMB 1420 / SS-2) TaxID=1122177 RepID=A0A2D0N2E3_FLAN2|nr:YetF domain-containing protein [Flavilitoribacter nigricans]PHN02665.1 DUF421 domain-containing protein [Flavilitoribacter nigricans DSM 23189 = NBRC 102662]